MIKFQSKGVELGRAFGAFGGRGGLGIMIASPY